MVNELARVGLKKEETDTINLTLPTISLVKDFNDRLIKETLNVRWANQTQCNTWHGLELTGIKLKSY